MLARPCYRQPTRAPVGRQDGIYELAKAPHRDEVLVELKTADARRIRLSSGTAARVGVRPVVHPSWDPEVGTATFLRSSASGQTGTGGSAAWRASRRTRGLAGFRRASRGSNRRTALRGSRLRSRGRRDHGPRATARGPAVREGPFSNPQNQAATQPAGAQERRAVDSRHARRCANHHHVPRSTRLAVRSPTLGATVTGALGASAHIMMPPAARMPPAAKKAVERLAALSASCSVARSIAFGQMPFAPQSASFFLLEACRPNTVPSPKPTTPTPAVTRPIAFHGDEEPAADEPSGVLGIAGGLVVNGPGGATGGGSGGGAAAAMVTVSSRSFWVSTSTKLFETASCPGASNRKSCAPGSSSIAVPTTWPV